MSTSGETVHAHHAIDYVEITVTDIQAAKDFYASAFGWSLVDYGPDYAIYSFPGGVASTSPTRPATSSPSGRTLSRRRSPRATTRRGR
jgi:predicted enzyme related to lactoylglutathione lyase